MLKKLLAFVIIFAVLLLAALSFITARYIDKEEILRAKREREELRAQRDSILTLVARKDSMQKQLQIQVDTLKTETAYLRNKVDSLEEKRQEEQLAVRFIRREEDLQQKFKETFPEMAYSDWGITEVYNEEEDVSLRYLSIPLWFSETFIIDHQNAESYREQRDKLLQVDSLQQRMVTLKDSLFLLETQKRLAYETGYNDAYAKYDSLNQKYIDLLQKPPQIKVGWPNWGTIIGATAVGTLVGTQIEFK